MKTLALALGICFISSTVMAVTCETDANNARIHALVNVLKTQNANIASVDIDLEGSLVKKSTPVIVVQEGVKYETNDAGLSCVVSSPVSQWACTAEIVVGFAIPALANVTVSADGKEACRYVCHKQTKLDNQPYDGYVCHQK